MKIKTESKMKILISYIDIHNHFQIFAMSTFNMNV